MEILTIENKAGKAKLTDAIFKESTDKLLEEIGSVFGAKAMAEGQDFGVLMNCAENAVDTLEIEIHSPGGSILDGYRIHHAIMDLRGRGVHVTAFINTLAASMASVIAMAADKIKIAKGGRMMIHEASTSTWGNAEDHARSAKLLDEMSAEIAGIYAERTGKPAKEMRDRMKEETWMSAETAVAEGFADEVVGGKFDTPKKAGMNLLERLTSPSNEEALAKIEALENAAQAHDSAIAEITGKLETAEGALQEAITGWQEDKVKLTTAEARVTELEAKATEDAATIADLTAKATKTAEAVALEAARVLAAQGHPQPVEDDISNNGEGRTPHLDKFNSLKGREATAYFNEHKAAIGEEQKLTV